MAYPMESSGSIKACHPVKYHNHNLHGLLVVDKPAGFSSMAVVSAVRRHGGHCKTGHAGTLDPMATGVLICCLGRATKAVPHLMGLTKIYRTTINLLAHSTTDDAEGELTPVQVKIPPERSAVEQVLKNLTGWIDQIPPAFSAIQIGGQRAYAMARRGEDVELAPRRVRIDQIHLDRYEWPELDLTITCGKGTYIRSLARQIGAALGTGGYLTALRRTAIGPYTEVQAITPMSFPDLITPTDLLPIPDAEPNDDA